MRGKIVHFIFILFTVTFFTFLLLHLAPGDPAEMKLRNMGVVVEEIAIEKAREEMGLNAPFLVQYGRWVGAMLQGDLGNSYKDGEAVFTKILRSTKYTIQLALSSLLLALFVAVPLAIVAATHKGRWVDRFILGISFVGNSLPNFVIAMGLMYFFSLKWRILPILTNQSLRGLILPSASLAIALSGKFIRLFRAEILEQLAQEYVHSARMRGVYESVLLYKNVLHNSLPGMLNVIGLSLGTLLGGTVIIETIFVWPGLGKLAMDAISSRDYPVILGFVIWMSCIFIGINSMIDWMVAKIDKRVKVEGGALE
jgi:peptide/nickel transport system permease protein